MCVLVYHPSKCGWMGGHCVWAARGLVFVYVCVWDLRSAHRVVFFPKLCIHTQTGDCTSLFGLVVRRQLCLRLKNASTENQYTQIRYNKYTHTTLYETNTTTTHIFRQLGRTISASNSRMRRGTHHWPGATPTNARAKPWETIRFLRVPKRTIDRCVCTSQPVYTYRTYKPRLYTHTYRYEHATASSSSSSRCKWTANWSIEVSL